MKRSLQLILLMLISSSMNYLADERVEDILTKVMEAHDPNGRWQNAQLDLHIQEPRVVNPFRYSIISLNNQTGAFSLARNRDNHVASYDLDNAGKSTVKLDNKIIQDEALIKKYRLAPEMSAAYRGFYQFYYGLPMSLKTTKVTSHESSVTFNNQSAHRVSFELPAPVISPYWDLFFSATDYTMLGAIIRFPDEPEKNDLILFQEYVDIDGINIPRIRHWHNESDRQYNGSDIIIKLLTD